MTAHLGNGCSCTAVRNGKSVDTTMGLTPLEGVMMGTRSGSVDPAIIGHMATALGQPEKKILDALNKKSGLAGRLRPLQRHAHGGGGGRTRATSAPGWPWTSSATCSPRRWRRWWCRWGGSTRSSSPAGIGENSALVRARVVEQLGFLGLELDPALNAKHGREHQGRITVGTRPQALVVPTNEELMIAMDTSEIAQAHAQRS